MSHVTFQEGAKKLQLSIVSCFCFESGCLSVKRTTFDLQSANVGSPQNTVFNEVCLFYGPLGSLGKIYSKSTSQ